MTHLLARDLGRGPGGDGTRRPRPRQHNDGMSVLGLRALNRALLARQGLLRRHDAAAVEVVERIGPIQAQHWPAVAAALWSRTSGFAAGDLYAALHARHLVMGTLLRGTLHVVSARQHPSYAAVVRDSEATAWRRTDAEPAPEVDALRADLVAHASSPRTRDELVAFVEAWIDQHRPPVAEAELAFQRGYRWRPLIASCGLVRAPAGARWDGARPPAASVAPPAPPSESGEDALDAVVRWHLRAFGPAAADDVAAFIGWRTPPVRASLERLAPELFRFEDDRGRAVYDLPDAPRPDPDTPAPVRLLPWFDSALLAYTPRHRARILPDEYRDRVYVRANLQWLPTFLVDGLVAGTWSAPAGRREAVLALRPFAALPRPVGSELTAEAERLVRFLRPEAATHRVTVDV
jgi:Winged helix DNA-binding domain